MRTYIPYLIVPALYGILFAAARGGFSAAAALLNRRIFGKMNLPDAAVRTALLIFLAADLLAAASSAASVLDDTVRDGYLMREDYGGASYTRELHVKTAGGEADVAIEVAPRRYTASEAEAILSEAAEAAREIMLGGQKAAHVNGDLVFFDRLPDLPVSVIFQTSDPELIDWEGRLGEDIPMEGAAVTVTADLFFDGEVDIKRETEADVTVRTEEISLTVFPREETKAERLARLSRVSAEKGQNVSSDRLLLPGSVDGQAAEWSGRDSGDGLIFLFLGGAIAIVFLFAKQSSDREAERKRREALSRDYPLVVGKVLLLLKAGMSIRGAFEKIAADYRRSLAGGGRRREGLELMVSLVNAMANGVPESAALRNLAENAPVREYRTMGLLLLGGVRKGTDEAVRLLAMSEAEAFEERRKAARVLGEEAETKMIFPMLLLMGVVFALLLVPAVGVFG